MVIWYFLAVFNAVMFGINIHGNHPIWAGIDAILFVWCLSKIIKVKEE